MSNEEFIVVYCSVPNRDIGKKIATTLVKDKVAACVSVLGNMTSIYRWKGEIHTDGELLLLIKSTKNNYEDIQRLILALHPYEVPEIIAVPLWKGNPSYLAWIEGNINS